MPLRIMSTGDEYSFSSKHWKVVPNQSVPGHGIELCQAVTRQIQPKNTIEYLPFKPSQDRMHCAHGLCVGVLSTTCCDLVSGTLADAGKAHPGCGPEPYCDANIYWILP